MKLTQNDRDAFVRAVMNDVPTIDYVEQSRALVLKQLVQKLPPKIKAIWNDSELRGFIKCDAYFRPIGSLSSVYGPPVEYSPDAATMVKLQGMSAAKTAQHERLQELRSKVSGAIQGCTTLKQAKERLPEFEKYLPADRDGTGVNQLPAIANVVADLVKAGWPKDKNKKQVSRKS